MSDNLEPLHQKHCHMDSSQRLSDHALRLKLPILSRNNSRCELYAGRPRQIISTFATFVLSPSSVSTSLCIIRHDY